MAKQNQKQSVGCRITASKVSEIDAAAEGEGMTRAQWIEFSIDRQLGKRPRRTVLTRLARLEQKVNVLESDRTCISGSA